MITELSVENLAIIDRATLQLGPGLTVLTGETGAGKSLLIDALELALGERADTEMVRAGARSASVSVAFDLSSSPDAALRCDELGVALEDGTLFVQREVMAEGRSQSRISGRLAPVSVLKQIGQSFVDLHGQHDHQSLLFPDRHLSFLDQWIGMPTAELLARVGATFERVRSVRARLESLRTNARDREHALDLLRYQVAEIEQVSPNPGEADEVEAQISRLQHIEKLSHAAYSAHSALCEQDNSALDLLGRSVADLEDAARFDPALAEILAPLQECRIQLDEALRSLSSYAQSLDADPAQLEELAGRLDALKRLRRKYGDDEAAVLAFLDSARSRLAELENSEAGEGQLVAELEQLTSKLIGEAAELSALRREKGAAFSSLVEGQLKDLALERARFEVVFRPKEPDQTGSDDAEFFFTANPGEPLRPLSRIASGGEVSRLMLAIKSVLAGKAGVPTLVFDEVDTGLGGRVASTLGRKLEELSRSYQVLVISHLPQVAACAGTHFKIEKVESDGRTVTQVRRLSADERVHEIARMVGGETVTPAAVENARDLLGGRAGPVGLFD